METNKFVKEIRELLGVAQGALARTVGISQQALSGFESGKSTLSTDTLQKICAILNINPLYVKEEKGNPFFSKKLIKLFLKSPLLSSIDYSIINFIADVNQKIDVLFLAPDVFKIIGKLIRVTPFETPIYSIVCKDQDDNIFLFRSKAFGGFLSGERELQVTMNQKAKAGKKKFSFKTIGIDEPLYKKIDKWTVERKDIESLFNEEGMISLNDERIALIKKLENAKIIPTDDEIAFLRYLRNAEITPKEARKKLS